jgi:hypothetical protein
LGGKLINNDKNMETARKYSAIIVLSVLVLCVYNSNAQNYEYRIPVSFKKKIVPGLDIEVSPELRLIPDKDRKELLLETQLEYSPLKFLEFGAAYRYNSYFKEDKATTYANNFFVDTKLNYGIFNFDFQGRVRYSNYSEWDADADENTSDPYFRFRLKVKYDIKKLKLTPYVSRELFMRNSDNTFNKAGTSIGLSYKLSKKQKLVFEYENRKFLKSEKTNNIFTVGYKFKF